MHRAWRCPSGLRVPWVVSSTRWSRAGVWRTKVDRLVWRGSESRAGHWTTSDCRDVVLVLDSGLWVHTLLWTDVTQAIVVGRLGKVLSAEGGA